MIILRWDCSGFATWAFDYGDAEDPNGLAFDGLGDSEIMLANPELNPHYQDNERAMCAALGIYFGGNLPQHVIIHLDEPGATDPLVGSMGSNAGPLVLPKSWEDTAHPGQSFTWLSVGKLVR